MTLRTEIEAKDTNTALSEARNLRSWLEEDQDLSSMNLDLAKATTDTGEQAGDERKGILQIEMESTDAPRLARSIQNWLKEHSQEDKKNLRLKIQRGDKIQTLHLKDIENTEQALTKAIREVIIDQA